MLVFDKSREQGGANENKKDVLFIDASKEFVPGKTKTLFQMSISIKSLIPYKSRKRN